MEKINFINELTWRGMISDKTPHVEEKLSKGPCHAYIGFDPTSDSFHVGSLVQIMTLVHLRRAGHNPIALIGGTTGSIGDPSGKEEERKQLDRAVIKRNCEALTAQLTTLLNHNPLHSQHEPIEIMNNVDWLETIAIPEFLYSIGKHISISVLLSRDHVKSRLNKAIQEKKAGMSLSEFSYAAFQAYDFLHLHKTKNCSIQIGGRDQWGNIVSGIDLIERVTKEPAHGIVTPLLTMSSGTKFGKTEQGTVWLDKTKTSAYQFYQYWLNLPDDAVGSCLRVLSTLPKENIEDIERIHKENPAERIGQKELAKSLTQFVHGETIAEKVSALSGILFGSADLERLSSLLTPFEKDFPLIHIQTESINEGLPLINVLTENKICPSRAQARSLIHGGGVYINRKRQMDSQSLLTKKDILPAGNDDGKYILLKVGKKSTTILSIISSRDLL